MTLARDNSTAPATPAALGTGDDVNRDIAWIPTDAGDLTVQEALLGARGATTIRFQDGLTLMATIRYLAAVASLVARAQGGDVQEGNKPFQEQAVQSVLDDLAPASHLRDPERPFMGPWDTERYRAAGFTSDRNEPQRAGNGPWYASANRKYPVERVVRDYSRPRLRVPEKDAVALILTTYFYSPANNSLKSSLTKPLATTLLPSTRTWSEIFWKGETLTETIALNLPQMWAAPGGGWPAWADPDGNKTGGKRAPLWRHTYTARAVYTEWEGTDLTFTEQISSLATPGGLDPFEVFLARFGPELGVKEKIKGKVTGRLLPVPQANIRQVALGYWRTLLTDRCRESRQDDPFYALRRQEKATHFSIERDEKAGMWLLGESKAPRVVPTGFGFADTHGRRLVTWLTEDIALHMHQRTNVLDPPSDAPVVIVTCQSNGDGKALKMERTAIVTGEDSSLTRPDDLAHVTAVARLIEKALATSIADIRSATRREQTLGPAAARFEGLIGDGGSILERAAWRSLDEKVAHVIRENLAEQSFTDAQRNLLAGAFIDAFDEVVLSQADTGSLAETALMRAKLHKSFLRYLTPTQARTGQPDPHTSQKDGDQPTPQTKEQLA